MPSSILHNELQGQNYNQIGLPLRNVNINGAEKSAKYVHCRRLLLVQLFGVGSFRLGHGEVVDIVRPTLLSREIDEVWVARQKWIALDHYEIVWDRVRRGIALSAAYFRTGTP